MNSQPFLEKKHGSSVFPKNYEYDHSEKRADYDQQNQRKDNVGQPFDPSSDSFFPLAHPQSFLIAGQDNMLDSSPVIVYTQAGLS